MMTWPHLVEFASFLSKKRHAFTSHAKLLTFGFMSCVGVLFTICANRSLERKNKLKNRLCSLCSSILICNKTTRRMFKWSLIIAGTAYVFDKLFRDTSSDEDHPSRGSASPNTSARNSSCENNHRQDQSDRTQPNRTQPKYYDYYPNLPTSSSTTKRNGAVSYESEYVNKFMEGDTSQPYVNKFMEGDTSQPSFSSKPTSVSSKPSVSPTVPPPSSSSPKPSIPTSKARNSRTSQPSFSSKPSFPERASVSSKPSVSPTVPPPSSPSPQPSIPTSSSSFSTPAAPPFTSDQPRSSAKQSPSPCGPSQSATMPTSSSPRTPESSKPSQCPLCFNPTNEQMESNNTRVQKGASFPKAPQSSKPILCPLSFSPTKDQMKANYPQDIASPIKKDIEPEDLKKPLSQKAPSSSHPTLSSLRPDPNCQQENDCYISVDKGASAYKIPKDIEDLIEKDIVPDVLKKPLSPSTYKDYFAALLYAEDFYIEKWSDFQLSDVTLEVNKAAIYDKSLKNKNLEESDEEDDKLFVTFEIDSIPERRPFLLSRDFVYARRSGSNIKAFKGILYRVVKKNIVLVEFQEDFYWQHHPEDRYDVSFSFNRVCLKRAHQAIAAASSSLFENYLFPDFTSRKNISSSETCEYGNHKLDSNGNSAVRRILSLQGRPPYLVEGPPCVTSDNLSKTGLVVGEAVFEIYKRSSKCRILVCAPINRTGDRLMRSLKNRIPESDMFRANAAFREVDDVPDDILPLCLYEGGECFQLPSLQELMKIRVIFSTFTSSFRLHNEDIPAGHFTHIFLVDASSATEPETIIALTNLANENTSVILTGAPNNRTRWVRSDIARRNGLTVSYFERLQATKTYSNFDPMFITTL